MKDDEMLRWSRQHHGLVRWADGLALGLTPHQMVWRVRIGILERVHPRVYRHVAAPVTEHQRQLAAVWAAGAAAMLSHASAAWLWGLADAPLLHPHVTLPGGCRSRVRGVVVHRSVDLPTAQCCERAGIPVTDPFRTLIDVGAAVPPTAVADAVDRAVAMRLVTVPGLLAALDRVGRQGVRGAGVLRRVLTERGAQSDRYAPSVLESKAARVFRLAGLPDAVPELVAGSDGEYRLDFPWPEAMLVVEVEGWAFHSSPEQHRADLARANRLAAAGWLRLAYTWLDIVRRPSETAAEVARQYVLRTAKGA